MFWFFLLGVVALIFISIALVRKSRGYSQAPKLKDVNDSSKALKSELFKLQFSENAEKYGERVSSQFEELERKYNAYLQTLNQKFNPSEITYDRYLGPVQQVHQSLTENFKKLRDVTIYIGNNASAIKELNKKNKDAWTPEENQKNEIHQKNLTHFEEISSLTQKALNELDNLTQSLAQITSSQSSDPKQIEYLVKELGELAVRAKKYELR